MSEDVQGNNYSICKLIVRLEIPAENFRSTGWGWMACCACRPGGGIVSTRFWWEVTWELGFEECIVHLFVF